MYIAKNFFSRPDTEGKLAHISYTLSHLLSILLALWFQYLPISVVSIEILAVNAKLLCCRLVVMQQQVDLQPNVHVRNS